MRSILRQPVCPCAGVTCAIVIAACAASRAEAQHLTADQLLLVYNGREPASRELAEHYARTRGVAADRLFAVSVAAGAEEIARDAFERDLREPIKRHIEENGLEERVRCLVTFYGLPIRVGPLTSPPISAETRSAVEKQLEKTMEALEAAIGELNKIGGIGADVPANKAGLSDDRDVRMIQRYVAARFQTVERIQKLTDPAEQAPASQQLTAVIGRVEGVGSLVAQLQPAGGNAAAERQIGAAREQVRQVRVRVRAVLARGLDDPGRPEAYALIRQVDGLIGLLAMLKHDLDAASTDETHAAVDSELMLLAWPAYAKHRWIPNTLNWRLRVDPLTRARLPVVFWEEPVFLVSRLDGPSPGVVRRMIDDAPRAEREGLRGTVYLDSRGLEDGDEGLAVYDANLRELGRLLLEHTTLKVVRDDRPEVFRRATCPDAMLYCGWYSLRKYVDAFEFVPGAVAWHIASFEAISLKGRRERGWCKSLLEDGAAATLGPVAEPYLQSFPLPRDFFGLLLTGKLTLVECYAATAHFNSWMNMLLGDPLYRPFAKNPSLDIEKVYPAPLIPPSFRTDAAATQPASVPGP